jgi:hypothetical protein
MKIRFNILTLLVVTAAVAAWFASLDPHGELEVGESMSSMGDRYFRGTYLVRRGKWEHVPDKLELGIIQSELGSWPPDLEFEFHWLGKYNLNEVSPPQWPVAAVKFGGERISLPSGSQLHEIWDGEHSALDTDLAQELFQRFINTSDSIPRLSQLQAFLDEQSNVE